MTQTGELIHVELGEGGDLVRVLESFQKPMTVSPQPVGTISVKGWYL